MVPLSDGAVQLNRHIGHCVKIIASMVPLSDGAVQPKDAKAGAIA